MDRDGSQSIWDLTGTFQAYDPVALLAALPGIRDRFLAPHTVAVEDCQGDITFHEVVGLSEQVTGVQPDAPLGEWLHVALLDGLTASSADVAGAQLWRKTLNGDLQLLENGVGADDDDASTHRGSSAGGSVGLRRRSYVDATSSIESVRSHLRSRYQERSMLATTTVHGLLSELGV
jgi:hypothetical protein